MWVRDLHQFMSFIYTLFTVLSLACLLQHLPVMLRRATNTDGVRSIILARDNYWRRARLTLTPTFSAHKMKLVRAADAGHDVKTTSTCLSCLLDASEWPSPPQMEPLIAESVSRLLAKFEKAAESGKSVDVLEYFGRYTMEVILASAFGRYKDIQSVKERDKLAEAADAIFGTTKENSTVDGAVLRKWLCGLAYL